MSESQLCGYSIVHMALSVMGCRTPPLLVLCGSRCPEPEAPEVVAFLISMRHCRHCPFTDAHDAAPYSAKDPLIPNQVTNQLIALSWPPPSSRFIAAFFPANVPQMMLMMLAAESGYLLRTQLG